MADMSEESSQAHRRPNRRDGGLIDNGAENRNHVATAGGIAKSSPRVRTRKSVGKTTTSPHMWSSPTPQGSGCRSPHSSLCHHSGVR
jgi:hypothetical protein